MIIDRLREQLSLRVVFWNSLIYIDHSRSNKAPPTDQSHYTWGPFTALYSPVALHFLV